MCTSLSREHDEGRQNCRDAHSTGGARLSTLENPEIPLSYNGELSRPHRKARRSRVVWPFERFEGLNERRTASALLKSGCSSRAACETKPYSLWPKQLQDSRHTVLPSVSLCQDVSRILPELKVADLHLRELAGLAVSCVGTSVALCFEAQADVFLMQNQFDQPLGCLRVMSATRAMIQKPPGRPLDRRQHAQTMRSVCSDIRLQGQHRHPWAKAAGMVRLQL